MIFNVGPSGLSPYPDFTFTVGTTDYVFNAESTTSSINNVYYFNRNGVNWEFYAKANGTITFGSSSKVDIFMLGNGNSGGDGSYSVTSQYYPSQGYTMYWCNGCWGGGGGPGGTRKTTKGQILSGAYAVSISTISSFGSYKSNDTGYSQSGAGVNGGYCFDDPNAVGIDGSNDLVGAGGGSGGASLREGEHVPTVPGGEGGTRGGGSGGDAYSGGGGAYAYSGSSASYWGAGGGGGAAWGNGNQNTSSSGHGGKGSGASGYKGFVAMRNAR